MEKQKQLKSSRQGVTSFPCYSDFSRKDHEWVEKRFNLVQKQPSRGTKATFPQCLYYMLERVEHTGCSNIVSFQPHGRSFKVYDRKLFAVDILPRYFKHQTKIASFSRQLNIYGFLRMIKPGPDQDSYYHPFFLRGRPDLCRLIPRNLMAPCSARQTYDPSTEPDFYTMLPVNVPNQLRAYTDVSNDESNRIISTMTPDRQQCIGDGGLTLNSKMSAEAPINHFGDGDTIMMSFMDTFLKSCASATDFKSINYPLPLEWCSILEPNPIIQTFSRHRYNLFTEIDHCHTSQSMEKTEPNKLSDDATLNFCKMSGNYSDEICKVKSLLPLSNQTQPSCSNMHDIEPIQCMNSLPLMDTSRAGTVNDRNIANGPPNERSNMTEVLSQRMLDVDFVNPQQQHAPQTGGNRNSNTRSESNQSLGTSGSVPIYYHGHWDTKTISLMDTYFGSGTSTIDQGSINYPLQSELCSILEPNPITQSFSRQEYNECTKIDHLGMPKSTEAKVSNTFLDDATLNGSGMTVNHCDEIRKIQSLVSSLYQAQPSHGNMDDNDLRQCIVALPFKDASHVVSMYDQNTMNITPNDRFDTTEILSFRMFADDFVHQEQQHADQSSSNNYDVLSDQDELSLTSESGVARYLPFEDVDLESDDK